MKVVSAKFNQNNLLKNQLLNTGQKTIAESSYEKFWGTGLHLYDRSALDNHQWQDKGGVTSEILSAVCGDWCK